MRMGWSAGNGIKKTITVPLKLLWKASLHYWWQKCFFLFFLVILVSGKRCWTGSFSVAFWQMFISVEKNGSRKACNTSAMNTGHGIDCSVIIPDHKSCSGSQCSLDSFSPCCPVWAIFSLPVQRLNRCRSYLDTRALSLLQAGAALIQPALELPHFHCQDCQSAHAVRGTNREKRVRDKWIYVINAASKTNGLQRHILFSCPCQCENINYNLCKLPVHNYRQSGHMA